MFDSMLGHKDLLFQDATIRLMEINDTIQTYQDYLGPAFIRAMERHESVDCVTGSHAVTLGWGTVNLISFILLAFLSLLIRA